MDIVNMTPHPINLLDEDNNPIQTIAPSGDTIRLSQEEQVVDSIDGVDVLYITFSASDSLPEPIEGTYFIVSALVANAYPERIDFLMVAGTVRDENGRIAGCTAWATARGSLSR